MNNITEKYNGKNGYEGCIVHFKIIKYEIDLLQKTIFVKYDMVVENSLADNVIVINKKSYIRQDIQKRVAIQSNEITPPTFDENGNILTEGVYEDVEVVTVEENLAFTTYQKFPLQYGIDNGMQTLEDVFFKNTTEHILYVNGYSEEDLVSNTL